MALNWMDLAACRGLPVDYFFDHLTAIAKEVCTQCPVQQQCLDFAMEAESVDLNGWRFGLFGGMDAKARRNLAREREGRPPIQLTLRQKERSRREDGGAGVTL